MSVIAMSSPTIHTLDPSVHVAFSRQSPLVKHNASPLSPPMSSASTSASSSLQNSPRDYVSVKPPTKVPSRSSAPMYTQLSGMTPRSIPVHRVSASCPVNESQGVLSPREAQGVPSPREAQGLPSRGPVMTRAGSNGRMVVIGMSSSVHTSSEHSRRQKRSSRNSRVDGSQFTTETDVSLKSPRTPRERKNTTYYLKEDLENIGFGQGPVRRSHGTMAVAEAVRARLATREQNDAPQPQIIPAVHSFDASYFHSPPVISGSRPDFSHSFSLNSAQTVKFRRSVMVTEVPDINELSAPSTAYLKRYTKCIKAQDGKTRGKMRPKSSQVSRVAARNESGK